MTPQEYNYAVFNLQAEMPKFTEFPDHPLHAGRQAADFDPVGETDTPLSRSIQTTYK